MKSKLTKNQVIEKSKKVNGNRIKLKIRYDDQCNNGHNSFSITGTLCGRRDDSRGDDFISCGCIHDEIEKYFPEYKHLIKWHGMTSQEPLYYIENTTFYARDKDHKNAEVGEAVAWDKKLKFKDIPFTFEEQKEGFWDYLDNIGDFNNIEVKNIKYDDDSSFDFTDKFSLTGFIKENEEKKWYKAPFRTLNEAEEFLQALRTKSYSIVKTPYDWCKSVTPDIKAARSCAIWKDATLEQLQDEKALKDRLPKLMAEFKRDIEKLGMIF